ncbi:MAG: hypothetical protein IPP12_22355 [Nitrospira sp.]|nr:hypothetical protein [Nitrospira sp.]
MEHILDALFAFAMAVELTFYGPNPPETLDERRDRIEMIVEVDTEVSHSIDSEFDPRDAAALLLTTQIGESKLEYYVHAGLEVADRASGPRQGSMPGPAAYMARGTGICRLRRTTAHWLVLTARQRSVVPRPCSSICGAMRVAAFVATCR